MKPPEFLRAASGLFASDEAARVGRGTLTVSPPSGKHRLPRCGRCCVSSNLFSGQPRAWMWEMLSTIKDGIRANL